MTCLLTLCERRENKKKHIYGLEGPGQSVDNSWEYY